MIEKPRFVFVNIHHSHNLYLRGRGMSSRAVLESNRIPYHGTCIHYTDDRLDTGPILELKTFDILDTDTAWDLSLKADACAENLSRGSNSRNRHSLKFKCTKIFDTTYEFLP